MSDDLPDLGQLNELSPAQAFMFANLRNLEKAFVEQTRALRETQSAFERRAQADSDRVQLLEQRFAAMEARQVTREDLQEGQRATHEELKALKRLVDTLVTEHSERRGAAKTIGGISVQTATWIGILLAGASALIALAALMGVGANRSELNRIERPAAIEQSR